MTTKKIDRLNAAVAFLKGQQFLKTQNDIARRMSMDPHTISQALRGNVAYLTDSFVTKFCATFPQINANWMLYGEGEMLKDEQQCMAHRHINSGISSSHSGSGDINNNDLSAIMEHYEKMQDSLLQKNAHMERVYCDLKEAVVAKDEQLRNKDIQIAILQETIKNMQLQMQEELHAKNDQINKLMSKMF